MKYRVIHTCYGFQGMYWTRDDVVEIDPKFNPPVEHFLLLEVAEAPTPVVPEREDEEISIPREEKPPVVVAKTVVKTKAKAHHKRK